jgi:hypothetical protein
MNTSDIGSGRVDRPADMTKVLLSEGMQKTQGFVIKTIELKQYIERRDDRLGDYSLLTVMVETDKGTVEMKYDEGFRGSDALESAVKMLTHYVGLGSIINRALIELERK